MHPRIPGIKWKLFGYLLSFCVLLLLILVLMQTVFLDRFYVMIKQSQVKKQIADISSHVETADWEGLSAVSDEPGDIFVEVWGLPDGLVFSSGNFRDGIHTQLKPNEMEALLSQLKADGGSITRRYQELDKDGRRMRENLVSAQLVSATDGNTYVALVSAGLSPVEATVDTLRVQLVCISILMLLLSIGLALLISRNVSRPIVAISQTAGELGKGKYNIVFRGSGYREVVQLADVLTEAAGELSITEALRQELISNVSHELRTPLTLIAGYGEMIRDMPEEATAENMQVIIDETNRLSSLVNDLLDLSKLQAGTVKMHMEPFDLGELAEEIVGRVARLCEQDGYAIAFTQPKRALVNGDRERIAQVIYNFLLNAVAHTGGDKRIDVRLIENGHAARLEICDTGPGIAAKDLPHIWERYYRDNEAHRGTLAGSGLGLSIVRSILDRHPGVAYGVDSEVGKGSTFWFSMRTAQTKA